MMRTLVRVHSRKDKKSRPRHSRTRPSRRSRGDSPPATPSLWWTWGEKIVHGGRSLRRNGGALCLIGARSDEEDLGEARRGERSAGCGSIPRKFGRQRRTVASACRLERLRRRRCDEQRHDGRGIPGHAKARLIRVRMGDGYPVPRGECVHRCASADPCGPREAN